jgi:hypothetical protein
MFLLLFVPYVKDEVLIFVRRPEKNYVEGFVVFIFVFVIGGCSLPQNVMKLSQNQGD